jgi:hypothetical protein
MSTAPPTARQQGPPSKKRNTVPQHRVISSPRAVTATIYFPQPSHSPAHPNDTTEALRAVPRARTSHVRSTNSVPYPCGAPPLESDGSRKWCQWHRSGTRLLCRPRTPKLSNTTAVVSTARARVGTIRQPCLKTPVLPHARMFAPAIKRQSCPGVAGRYHRAGPKQGILEQSEG